LFVGGVVVKEHARRWFVLEEFLRNWVIEFREIALGFPVRAK